MDGTTTGKSSRTKGHSFERFVARVLQVSFPDSKVSRGLQYRDPTMCDVEGTPFRIECKARKTFSYKDILDAIEQAERDGEEHGDDRFPLAITKKDRMPIMFHGKLEHLVGIIEKHFWAPVEPEDELVVERDG